MKTHRSFLDYSTWGMSILALLAGFASGYFLLQERGSRLPYVQVSNLHEIILAACELFLCLWLYTVSAQKAWGETRKVAYLLVFLLANCFLAAPFLLYYLDPARADIPLVRAIQPYLLPGYAGLLALTLVVACLSWADVRRFHRWLVTCNAEQKARDDQDASMRREGFRQRYPRLAGTPVVGWLAREITAENWFFWAALGLAGVGLALRLWNLDALPPYADETIHIDLGKAVVGGEMLTQLSYTRSLYSVTIPVVWSMKAFGVTLWAARFPGVLANSLATIPLYLIARRVNRPVALLAVGLWVFNPWMIATARTVREYAFYPLYFYLVAWWMVCLYEGFPDRIVLMRDFRKLLTVKNLSYIALLGLAFYYAYGFDRQSTFKIILGVYVAYGIVLFRKLEWRSWSNIFCVFAILGLSGILALRWFRPTGETNFYTLSLFFDHPEQQWYYNRPLISILILLLALLAIEFFDVRKATLPLAGLSYAITQISFLFLYIKGDKPRYAVPIEFWYVLLMASGFYAATLVGQRLFKRKSAVWIGLLLLFWNAPQALTPILNTTPGYAPITGELHADMETAYRYLQVNARESDVLIANNYFIFEVNWAGRLKFSQIIPLIYDSWKERDKVYAAIESHPSGWIVLFSRREDTYLLAVEPEDFEVAGKQVKFVGWYGDAYILHW